MSKLDGQTVRVFLYEGAGAERLDDEGRFELLSALLESGYETRCGATRAEIEACEGAAAIVLGQFDPTSAFEGNGHSSHDIAGLSAAEILELVNQSAAESESRRVGQWKPWFPVIDYDRCTNCMQCLSFCLFDVYSVDGDDKIKVQKQDNCKTDCPACSRVCPEAAILFPKYTKSPINGDVVREEDLQRESMKVDVSALLGGDIYASLRKRQSDARERFSTERDESRALLERRRCLKKLKKQLDIPSEVLMSLPTVGDIQERAERARAKMAKRMERSQTVQDQKPPPSVDDWGI